MIPVTLHIIAFAMTHALKTAAKYTKYSILATGLLRWVLAFAFSIGDRGRIQAPSAAVLVRT